MEQISPILLKVLHIEKQDIKEMVNNIIVLVDTREQKNDHILEYFDKFNIKYKLQKLDYGDYSFMIAKNKVVNYDIYFDNIFVIERKNSIDELAGNFGKDRSRIKSEFSHLKMLDIKSYIFVEDNLFDKHIREGTYRSKFSPQSLYSSLKAFENKYNTMIRPISKQYIGSEIYNSFKYYLLSIIN